MTEGYEKIDYFLKLYEEIIKTINYHHLLTSEDVRKLSKDLDTYTTTNGASDSVNEYEKEQLIAIHLQRMNTRMNYINKVFDYSKFSLRGFDLDDLVEFFNKTYQLGEITEIHDESRRVSYYDNFKQITGIMGEILENVNHSDSRIERFVLKADLTNGKHIIVFKIICEETKALTDFVNEFGKFVSIVIKCIGGVSEMTLRNGLYHISIILIVKEKTNDLFMIKGDVSE